jgi:hypothetical protein
MNVTDILYSASESSEIIGKIIFFTSGFIVSVYPLSQNYLPREIIEASQVLFLTSLLGVLYFAIKYRNILHPSTQKCLKCGSKMRYIGVSCLDEKRIGCTFTVKFDKPK